MQHLSLDVPPIPTLQFPLTPSSNSPFRAHRLHVDKQRPKPYQRPAAEFKLHIQQAKSGTSPFSPFTPTSLSSSSSSSNNPSNGLGRSHSIIGCVGVAAGEVSLSTPLDSESAFTPAALRPPPLASNNHSHRQLQRADSAPALLPFIPPPSFSVAQHPPPPPHTQPTRQQQQQQQLPTPAPYGSAATPSLLQPIFAAPSDAQPQSSPLVFSTEYIEARLAANHGHGHGNGNAIDVSGPPPMKSSQPQNPNSLVGAGVLPPTLPAGYGCQDSDLALLLSDIQRDRLGLPMFMPSGSVTSTFPYASAYVSATSYYQPPGYGLANGATAPNSKVEVEDATAKDSEEGKEKDSEEKKAKYASELIESAIRTLHKIWPETKEPDHVKIPGPVTSDGRLRSVQHLQELQRLQQQAAAESPKRHPQRAKLKANAQQVTPESSPDADRSSSKKRKRGVDVGNGEFVKEEEDEEAVEHALKKRSVEVCDSDGSLETKRAVTTLTAKTSDSPSDSDQKSTASALASASAASRAAIPAQPGCHITLRLFVRELLRRSKTSCNTLEVALCYLDGIEMDVKRLRDCLKLGISFGTAAMAERGPYDEGMKDEGRIISADEWKRLQMLPDDEKDDVHGEWHHDGEDWTPLSPESDISMDSKDVKSPKTGLHPQPSSHVLATHPLLDARRTFLASLVLATKFIQDKAYSNKAWAKLSGLAGKEVGRCERALGGALQWRLWVGKDCGLANGTKSPVLDEVDSCSGETESIVHGEDDALAKLFMAQVVEQQQLKTKAVVGSNGQSRDVVFGLASGPAPVHVPAPALQHAAGFQMAARNGCSRARTWPSLDLGAASTTSVMYTIPPPPPPPLSAASSCASLIDQMSAVRFSQPPLPSHQMNGLLSVHQASTSFGSTSTWPQLNSILDGSHFAPTSAHCASPLDITGIADDDFLEELLRIDCRPSEYTTPATVKMTEEKNGGRKSPMATPYLAMNASFACNEPSPPAGFAESWCAAPYFPFTFSLGSSMSVGPIVNPQQQQPQQQVQQQGQQLPQPQQLVPQPARQLWRSQSAGSLQPPLSAQSQGCGSGSSGSLHSASTFSSPEVITPSNSRSATLIESLDINDYMWQSSFADNSFQQCIDKSYSSGIVQHRDHQIQLAS